MKKLLLLGSLCLFLGTITTIGVAWYCTIWLDWNHWSPVARGPSELDAPLWLVDSYEAPGFKLAHAWPIFDSDDLFGKQQSSTYGYEPYSQKGPLEIKPWMETLKNAPNPGNDASVLKTIDLRGWPHPSMLRIFHTELDSKARLAVKSRVIQSWMMSDRNLFQTWGKIRKELVQSAQLPLKPYWPGFLFDTSIYTGAWAILFTTIALFSVLTKRWGFWHKCFVILLCFGLGVLATIGVAWGCSTWIDVGNNPLLYGGNGLRGSGEGPTGGEIWDITLNTKPGLTRCESKYLTVWMGSHLSGQFTSESLIPWWADNSIQINNQDHHMALYGSGWPVHALWWWEQPQNYNNPRAISHGGIELIPWPKSKNARWQGNGRALPLIPIWLGLIADTAFYSFCTFGLFAMWQGSKLTRRWWRLKHKGLCPNCKYDLRELTSDKCPECGHHINKSDIEHNEHQQQQ